MFHDPTIHSDELLQEGGGGGGIVVEPEEFFEQAPRQHKLIKKATAYFFIK